MSIDYKLPAEIDNLRIREWTKADAEGNAAIEFDSDIKKYEGLPRQNKIDYISSFQPDIARGYAIESMDGNELIGTVDLSKYADDNSIREIRIYIAKKFQCKGIGVLVTNYFIERLSGTFIKAIVAVIHKENEASVGLINKLGFIKQESSNSKQVYKCVLE